jgi:AraC-like DNA-binding protein
MDWECCTLLASPKAYCRNIVTDGHQSGLKKRDMLERKFDKFRGVLHLRDSDPMHGHYRYWPSEELAPFVEHYWTVEWNVDAPTLRETLPHPSVHIVFENGRGDVGGVSTKKFRRVLEGRGRAVSVKFRPGGFRPFIDGSVSQYTDRVVPLDAVFGATARALTHRVANSSDHQTMFGAIDEFLRLRHPQPDSSAELAARIAESVATDRLYTRVEQICADFDIGLRALQRLFNDYIGVGPKWIIQRYRLHEAAALLAADADVDGAAIALELGYADQAHFIRDFKRLIGSTPADYRKALIAATSASA